MRKFVNFLKYDLKYLIFIGLLVFMALYKLPYTIIFGGGLIDVVDRVKVEDSYPQEGSLNLVYVKQAHSTIATYLLSYAFDWDRIDINEGKIADTDTDEDLFQLDRVLLEEGNDNAIFSAYSLANKEINIKKFNYQVLYIYKEAKTDLQISDVILQFDNQEVTKDTDIASLINAHEYNDKIPVKVLRDNKEVECYVTVLNDNDSKKIEIYLLPKYDYEVTPKVEIKFDENETGSSAGFMLALAIYNRLVPDDITYKLKIAGTGTINSDGTVGEIGGVKYKVQGAISEKADLFFVPEENFEEAHNELLRHTSDLILVKVHSLKDAVDYLEANYG